MKSKLREAECGTVVPSRPRGRIVDRGFHFPEHARPFTAPAAGFDCSRTRSAFFRGIAVAVVLAVGTACDRDDEVSDEVPPPPRAAILDDDRMALGLQLLERSAPGEARIAFEAVLQDHPGHPRPRFLRALAIQKQGNYASALADYDAILAEGVEFDGRASVEHFRGWCLFYLGRPRPAMEAFTRHLELQPGAPDSEFGLGVSLLEIGEPALAVEAFDRSLELEMAGKGRRRSIAKAWIRRGDALWELGRIDEATHAFHKGVIQFPDHYEGWSKLGRGHERLGDTRKASWARREEARARERVGAVPVDGDGVQDG